MNRIACYAIAITLAAFASCKKDASTNAVVVNYVDSLYGNWTLISVNAQTNVSIIDTINNIPDSLVYSTNYSSSDNTSGDLNFSTTTATVSNTSYVPFGSYSMTGYVNGIHNPGNDQPLTLLTTLNSISNYNIALGYKAVGNDSLYFSQGGLAVYQTYGGYTVPVNAEGYKFKVSNDTLTLTTFIKASQTMPGLPPVMTAYGSLTYVRK